MCKWQMNRNGLRAQTSATALTPLGRTVVFDLVPLYSWLRSHCDFAQVEAAVQGERGGQEAQVTEGSPRGERLPQPPAALPAGGSDLTASRTYRDGRPAVLQNNDVPVLSAPAEACSSDVFVCLLCSWETFIWSCTGTFRAGVSSHPPPSLFRGPVFPPNWRLKHSPVFHSAFVVPDPSV